MQNERHRWWKQSWDVLSNSSNSCSFLLAFSSSILFFFCSSTCIGCVANAKKSREIIDKLKENERVILKFYHNLMRSMSPFASACLVQAVLVDRGWYWLCLLHYHTNNFQTFAQAQNNQHAETIALVQSVQWCTMMYNDVQCLFWQVLMVPTGCLPKGCLVL